MRKLILIGKWSAIAGATMTLGACLAAIPFNLAAERQEKVIYPEIEQWIEVTDKTWNPDRNPKNSLTLKYSSYTSAFKLRDLTHHLGFYAVDPHYVQTQPKLSQSNRQKFEQIEATLVEYLETVIKTEATPPPSSLQQYWQENELKIAEIRNFSRYYTTPRYPLNLDWVRYNDAEDIREPNGIGNLKNLQNILLLDALIHQEQGNLALASDSLDAAYELSLAVNNRLSTIEQADYLNLVQQQALILRKFDNLSPEFAERLAQDYHAAISIALRAKITADFNANSVSPLSQQTAISPETAYPTWLPRWGLWKNVAVRHNAIALYQTQKDSLEQLIANRSCNPEIADEKMEQLWQKATQLEQEIELTQLIVQAKAQYAQNREFPATLDNLASRSCPGLTWEYKLNADGTASLLGQGKTIVLKPPK